MRICFFEWSCTSYVLNMYLKTLNVNENKICGSLFEGQHHAVAHTPLSPQPSLTGSWINEYQPLQPLCITVATERTRYYK